MFFQCPQQSSATDIVPRSASLPSGLPPVRTAGFAIKKRSRSDRSAASVADQRPAPSLGVSHCYLSDGYSFPPARRHLQDSEHRCSVAEFICERSRNRDDPAPLSPFPPCDPKDSVGRQLRPRSGSERVPFRSPWHFFHHRCQPSPAVQVSA